MTEHLASTLARCIPDILDEWGQRAHHGELASIRAEERAGDLGQVLHAMCAALDPHRVGSGVVDDFIEVAAAHGARRSSQGIRESCLFEEYDLLGASVPLALRRCLGAQLSPEDLVSLEGGLTTAILAGLRGFHRGEFERRGSWPETIARAVTEAGELGPRRTQPIRRPPEGL
jgi:hypothetical protein